MSLPPLSALRVFDAASRQLSFTRAADTLGMTQAAVSYQIRLLEERLGAPLFLRKPKGLELTALGLRLAGPTAEAFDLLRETFSARTDLPETMSISTITTIASNWLAHRLGRFQLDHPELAVRLDSNDQVLDFAREEVDVALRYGNGDWKGLVCLELFPSELTPIIAPSLLARHGPVTCPADVVPLPWLNNTHRGWAGWLAMNDLPQKHCAAPRRIEFDAQAQLGRAALAGEGVALLNPRFFRFELATGALIQLFPACWPTGKSYWLVYPHARRNRPAIKAFQRFLMAEITAENAAMNLPGPQQTAAPAEGG
ncbi:MAG: LysR substrate-binding domain-containing protein [Paracoccus sp. (in: a-proteobacteria)]|nr:LysR substrate-binding domain-containing protein [Paracoccus sp. (in: a-proteobacteria)]